jgi:hypothetical protein
MPTLSEWLKCEGDLPPETCEKYRRLVKARELKASAGKATPRMRGLGDVVDIITTATGIKSMVKVVSKALGVPCGCEGRRQALNQIFPFAAKEAPIIADDTPPQPTASGKILSPRSIAARQGQPAPIVARPRPYTTPKPRRIKTPFVFNPAEPIRETPWPASIVRHCLYFVMPRTGNGVWQANIEQLRRRLDLFNGRRILSVVTGSNLDDPHEVAAALGGGFELLTFRNDKTRRECVAWLPMLERIASTDPSECFWFGHAKGVTKAPVDAHGTTVHEWARAMYAATLDDWPTIERLLTERLFAGAFRREGNFRVRGNHAWHYSGTFYWGRSARVFAREWRGIDPHWWGVESWPGRMCSLDESACIVGDNAGDLYQMKVWQESRKEFEAWNSGRFAMS